MNYLIKELFKTTYKTFIDEISIESKFEISFPLSSIGFTQSHIDIINDYCQASYCCERIGPFIEVIDSRLAKRDLYYTEFRIHCIATNVEKLADELYYISNILNEESEEYDDLDRISFFSEIDDYSHQLNKKVFYFPDLINYYWANLINGAYHEMASEYFASDKSFLKKRYRKFPEHRYGFWKCPKSKDFNELIFFSTSNWVIPPTTNLKNALQLYSGLDAISNLEDADIIEYNGTTILITNSVAVYFEQNQYLYNSIHFTDAVLIDKQIIEEKHSSKNIELQISLFDEGVNKTTKKRKSITKESNNCLKYKLSEIGDIVVIEYKKFSFIFFTYNPLTFEEIKDLNAYLHPAFSKTQHLIDLSITGNCNWKVLNDDTFEELCYDILYSNNAFDSSSIQKMGKSKSRDGGRDIVIKTRSSPTKESELFIFQCKFFSDSRSLSASKIPDAGNAIMHYGAKGYGVFTSTVIDSTLVDLLDGFSRNLGIDTSYCWSKYELERLINRSQALKNKYFEVEM